MTAAVLFDLGNTLAAYYRRDEFHPILDRAIARTLARLRAAGFDGVSQEVATSRALTENREAADFRFSPLADRLARIFSVPDDAMKQLGEPLCEAFLGPIFEIGKIYDDTHGALQALRSQGYRTAVVSNLPWGSPPALWRKELRRLGIAALVDAVVLCGDVGWRKPSRRIFDHAAQRLRVPSAECVFVGDDLEWDIAGSAAAGMRPVLIDRDDRHVGFDGARVRSLHELLPLLARV